MRWIDPDRDPIEPPRVATFLFSAIVREALSALTPFYPFEWQLTKNCLLE
jgi:hypothetical protein